ncbi:efflux RND transporter periplasmic adaptor subunit [Pseudomonas viridiflava]|uniref:RND family efflux transporter MFP subunit n=1 Tax=Pseudomonas viridiflava TaxID=33069 RepID=A0A3M5P828_PSEVI|nr:efflux RND transporter periplasmic adaptor subunit [Pseudomonas viridiflava]MBA1231803.1 efflux RND transporter periplasmic adaptor subunit [Pseudomonas viridiflava]RMT80909.1 RND family efflux transporter MFP subunit [Pseudomonas viridiflava]
MMSFCADLVRRLGRACKTSRPTHLPPFRLQLSLGCTVAITLTLGACSADKPEEKRPVRVAIQVIQPQNIATDVVLSGDIQARKVTDQSFRVSGKLVKRFVDVGDRVRVHQVLARLDPSEQRTNLESANADVIVRESRLRLAEQNYQRQQRLLPKGYTNLSEYQQARSNLDSARGDLASFRAQQATAREQVGYTELIAVADGVITARQAEEGQVVQAAAPVFSLAHDGERDAVFSAYESLLSPDRIGDEVTISPVGQPDIRLTGRIREITPIVSQASGTLRVRIALANAPDLPGLGTVVSARVENGSQRAVVLPWSALTRTQSQAAVWRVDDTSHVSLRKVRVLRYEHGQVVVAEGLSSGDRVVSQGLQFLYAGQRVEVVTLPEQLPAASLAVVEPQP